MQRRTFTMSCAVGLSACMRTPENTLLLANTSQRLAYMRKHLRPYWTPIEAGGIFLLADTDDALNEKVFNDLIRSVLVTSVDANAGKPNWEKLAGVLAEDVRVLFSTATLTPGSYQLHNYHLAYAIDGNLEFDSNGNSPTTISADPRFTFNVRGEHLALMRHLNTRAWRGMIEAMDPKRPYGNATYYYLDMAEALEESWPQKANDHGEIKLAHERRYQLLHREMLFAVQAFWVHAQL